MAAKARSPKECYKDLKMVPVFIPYELTSIVLKIPTNINLQQIISRPGKCNRAFQRLGRNITSHECLTSPPHLDADGNGETTLLLGPA